MLTYEPLTNSAVLGARKTSAIFSRRHVIYVTKVYLVLCVIFFVLSTCGVALCFKLSNTSIYTEYACVSLLSSGSSPQLGIFLKENTA